MVERFGDAIYEGAHFFDFLGLWIKKAAPILFLKQPHNRSVDHARLMRRAVCTLALFWSIAAVPAAGQTSSADATATAAPITSGDPVNADQLRAGEMDIPSPPADVALPVVEPIISNDEFNAAIPELGPDDDPELAKPLESITDFEARMATEQHGAKPADGQVSPLVMPALADGDAVEEIGDAPVRDVELAAPLPPLSDFEVAPVTFAEQEVDRETVTLRYATQIIGLEAADDLTSANLAGEFKSYSALRAADGKAANVAQIRARLIEDSVLMQRILASEGWYDAKVTTRTDRERSEAGRVLTAVIDVVPGTRFHLSDIIVTADPTVPAGLIEKNLALKIGEPIIATRVLGAEAQIAVTLPQQGYPFAAVGQRDILLDQETGDGVYTLPVDIGPRARFGGFATSGDTAFDADHIKLMARFKRGELYDSRKVDDLRQALVATGLFNTVAVQPERTRSDAGDGTEYVTMAVEQDAGPPRTIAGTLGYGTGEGIRVVGSWTHRNLFPPEGALIAQAIAGTQEQGAGLTFRRANAGQRDRTFELAANLSHSNYNAFEAYTGRLSAKVSYDSTPIWQKRLTYAYGVELLATSEDDYDFALGRRNRRTYAIAGLNGQLGLDRSDNLLNPTKGFRLTTLIQPEGSLQGQFSPYVRARIDGTGYFPVGDSIVLAGRFRLGTIQGVSRSNIAPSRRLYSGGGGSVRGFGYQQLGPRDPNNDPLGGRSLNEGAAELRYRFGNYGIVGFVDAGQVYESTMPQFSNIRYGVGIGGRFYTNFGPMRVDVATPINRMPGESRINVYVSIGQAF